MPSMQLQAHSSNEFKIPSPPRMLMLILTLPKPIFKVNNYQNFNQNLNLNQNLNPNLNLKLILDLNLNLRLNINWGSAQYFISEKLGRPCPFLVN